MAEKKATATKPKKEQANKGLLRIDGSKSRAKKPAEDQWRNIDNAVKNKTVVYGVVEAVESEPNLNILTSYDGKQIKIPINESGIRLITTPKDKKEETVRLRQVAVSMIGCKIEFIILGVDKKEDIIIASREEALNSARVRYYAGDNPRIVVGSKVEAEVLAVKEKAITVAVFGVDTSIIARDLRHEWTADARDYFAVGDIIPVEVTKIKFDKTAKNGSKEWCRSLVVEVNAKNLQEDRTIKAYEEAQIEARYFGTVTAINNGTYFMNLATGANAVAKTNMTNPRTMKGDKVCFVVKKKLEDSHTLAGIITRTVASDFK